MGYSIVKEDKLRKIAVNDVGKKLRKAFEWKAQGMKNEEILSRLQALGVKIYKQKLSMISSNPFYCGIIAHKTLKGRLVMGDHEKLISQELFLRIHNIRAAAGGKYGVSHRKENNAYPLKLFIKCGNCGVGYTGYTVTKKIKATGEEGHYHYYKCRTKGCNCNKSTAGVNKDFLKYLADYSIKPHLVAPLLYHMNHAFDRHYEESFKIKDALQSNLAMVDAKIEALEEDYYVDKRVPAETYDRLRTKLANEKKQILDNLTNSNIDSSNLKETFEWVMNISLKIPLVWDSGEIAVKEKLQKLLFPEGIRYYHKKGTFLTEKVNEVFALIPHVKCITDDYKNWTRQHFCCLVQFRRGGKIRTCDLLLPKQAR